jgi:hypothetical protein
MEKAQTSISFVHEAYSAGLQTGYCAGVLARIFSEIITKSHRLSTNNVVAPHGSQQLHPFAGKDASQSLPAFKGQMVLVGALAALGAMPCVDEPARSLQISSPLIRS